MFLDLRRVLYKVDVDVEPVMKSLRLCKFAFLCLLLALISCQDEVEFFGSSSKKKRVKVSYIKPKKVYEKTFSNGALQEATFTVNGSLKEHTLEIPLESQKQRVTESFNQEKRPFSSKIFRQGSLGERVTQEFSQEGYGILDILLVVDNSHSMKDEQKKLARKLEPLLYHVSKSDWRIGVTTTDPKRPCIEALFTPKTHNLKRAFRRTIEGLGTDGYSKEAGIKKAVELLKCEKVDWLREGSNIAVIIVSDEDNCRKGRHCSEIETQPDYLLNTLTDPPFSKTLFVDAKVYGIYYVPDTRCKEGRKEGFMYQEAIEASGGISGSICADSYDQVLMEISSNIKETLPYSYPLMSPVNDGSILVYIDHTLITDGYYITSDAIVFLNPPPKGSLITVNYPNSLDSRKSVFYLEKGVDKESIEVRVDGVLQDKNSYVFSDAHEIVFSSPPLALSQIMVSYKKTMGRWNSLYLDGMIDMPIVTKNGAVLDTSSYWYDKAASTLYFDPPPEDGETIRVEYLKKGEAILSYPLSLDAEHMEEFSVSTKKEGLKIESFSYENGVFSIEKEDFAEDRVLVLFYVLKGDDIAFYTLPHAPLPGSITAKELPAGCQQESVEIEENRLYSDCLFSKEDSLTISYQYEVDKKSEFVLEEVSLPQKATWRVWIDGEETFDYERDGNKIILSDAVAAGKAIKIEAIMEQMEATE